MTVSHNICGKFCTGFLFPSAYTSVCRPWSGGALRVTLQHTYASSAALCPLTSVDALSAQLSMATFLSARTATMQQYAFFVVGPVTWNGLPLEVRCLPRVFPSSFYGLLKTFFFRIRHGLGVPLSRNLEGALYKFRLID
jgi:hypothetical protein